MHGMLRYGCAPAAALLIWIGLATAAATASASPATTSPAAASPTPTVAVQKSAAATAATSEAAKAPAPPEAASLLDTSTVRAPLAARPPVFPVLFTGGHAARGTLIREVAGPVSSPEAAKATATATTASTTARVDPAPAAAALDAAKAVETAIEQASMRVSPAVVNIITVREVAASTLDEEDPDLQGAPNDLRDFLDRLRRRPGAPSRTQANGSGCIISADGFILTSEHVIRDSTDIKVTLSTRRKYPAKVVAADPRRDLAVIRIEAKDLPVAPLGDAATLKRGQFVLALGSPFGFGRDGQPSISFGIVSGTGRAILGIGREADRYYGNLIQTDAAVNPGNSGGPLINLDGQVVGVNAVISSQSGSSEGVGFAVPIMADTRRLIERLKRGEEIVYGYLGIEVQEVGEEEAKDAGVEPGSGAFIFKVLPDTPGARAGLKDSDIILSVNDLPVRDPDDVIQTVQATPVGEKVSLVVLRKGKREKIDAEVGRRPGAEEMLAADSGRSMSQWWRGMRLDPLTEELRTQTGLKTNDRGAFVKEVRDGSPAADAGLVPGMVIDQVGEKRITTLKEFMAAVTAMDGPCTVHVIGLGLKTILPLTAAAPKGDPKSPPEKSKRRPAVTPTATPTDKPAATPTDKPAVTPTEKPAATPTDKPASTATDKPAVTPTEKPVPTATDTPASTPTASKSEGAK
jgi:serine protease Do